MKLKKAIATSALVSIFALSGCGSNANVANRAANNAGRTRGVTTHTTGYRYGADGKTAATRTTARPSATSRPARTRINARYGRNNVVRSTTNPNYNRKITTRTNTANRFYNTRGMARNNTNMHDYGYDGLNDYSYNGVNANTRYNYDRTTKNSVNGNLNALTNMNTGNRATANNVTRNTHNTAANPAGTRSHIGTSANNANVNRTATRTGTTNTVAHNTTGTVNRTAAHTGITNTAVHNTVGNVNRAVTNTGTTTHNAGTATANNVNRTAAGTTTANTAAHNANTIINANTNTTAHNPAVTGTATAANNANRTHTGTTATANANNFAGVTANTNTNAHNTNVAAVNTVDNTRAQADRIALNAATNNGLSDNVNVRRAAYDANINRPNYRTGNNADTGFGRSINSTRSRNVNANRSWAAQNAALNSNVYNEDINSYINRNHANAVTGANNNNGRNINRRGRMATGRNINRTNRNMLDNGTDNFAMQNMPIIGIDVGVNESQTLGNGSYRNARYAFGSPYTTGMQGLTNDIVRNTNNYNNYASAYEPNLYGYYGTGNYATNTIYSPYAYNNGMYNSYNQGGLYGYGADTGYNRGYYGYDYGMGYSRGR